MNDYLQVVIVPLVMLLVSAAKAAPFFAPAPVPDGPRKNAWLLPWISAGLCSALAVVWGVLFPETLPTGLAARAVLGFFAGLSASGLYDGSLQPLKDALRSTPFNTIVLCLSLGLALAASGCMSIILPTDKDMLHRNALNAAAINAKVQAVQPAPAANGAAVMISAADWAAIRVWWAEEARAWWAIDLWAQGKDPAKNTYVPWSLAPPSAPAKEGGAL